MTPSVAQTPARSSAAEELGPGSTLWIYYLRGRLDPQRRIPEPAWVGSWEEEGFTFLFFVRPCPETVAHLQAAQPGLELLDDYCLSYADWQGEPLAPFTAGPIRVVPAWAAAADAPGGMQLRLHPGLVFGAGTHPTTRSCIEALGRLLARYPAERALDLGCGTGVLALAMARLGCRRVLAVDTNLLAVRTTRRNVRLNRLETQVLAVQGRAEDYFHGPAQLVVANLHFDAMMGMLTAPLPAQRRWLVLSGLLRSQTEAVCRHLARLGTCVVERISPDGIWTTLIAAHGGACP